MSKIRYLSDNEWFLVYLIGMLTLIPLLVSSIILLPEVNFILKIRLDIKILFCIIGLMQ